MNRDLIAIAGKPTLKDHEYEPWGNERWGKTFKADFYTADQVAAAIAAEREACAKVVEASPSYDWHPFACEAATAIRARGTK